MRHVRTFTALLLALLWVPAMNSSAVAWIFPELGLHCCHEDDDPDQSDDMSCDKFTTLQNGFQIQHLQMLKLAPALFVPLEPAWMPDLIRALATEAADKPPLASWKSPPPERTLWHFIARTTLPVRGPSLVA